MNINNIRSADEDHQRVLNELPTRRSTLQGPRPAALKVSKFSSSKIKKPLHDHRSHRRSPVVIYLVSPKIIHVRPEEFRGLVQRLTGKQASSSSSSTICCNEMGKNDQSVNYINGVKNYADDDHQAEDDQFIPSSLSPPSSLTPYSRLCIDIYSKWDDEF